ncbi:MAG TPA: rhomboid family intramembrane serine protease [Myxococcota bacterium]|nr:rhomboid family intramembrane serine protease [Myxococcota bacterium]HQK50963.1 rhomboid family intramembrane serine protease [Myxococcota bacterium]
MFLPFGDAPNPRRFRPWVTWCLIALNVGIYLVVSLPLSFTEADPRDPLLREYLRLIARSLPPGISLREAMQQVSAYDLFVLRWGFKPAAPEVRDLIASLFLHGGLAHLAGNMLFLWIYGDNVEQRLGRLGYLAAYLGTGVLATVAFALFNRHSLMPLVGASGAISGVLGLYFVLFPRNVVKVFVFLFPFVMTTVLLPARLVLLGFLVLDNLLPVFLGAESGVAYGAHIGGFVAGWGIARIGEALAQRTTWRWPGDRRMGSFWPWQEED